MMHYRKKPGDKADQRKKLPKAKRNGVLRGVRAAENDR